MLLLEGGAEASCASVAVKAEGPRFVSDRVPVRKGKNRRCGKFRKKAPHYVFHVGVKVELDSFFK